MKYTSLLFIFGIMFTSCSNENNSIFEEAEKAYAATPNSQTMSELSAVYKTYLRNNADANDKSQIQLKLANLNAESNQFISALKYYKAVIKDNLNSTEAKEAALGLSKLYGEKLNNTLGQTAVNQGISKVFPNAPEVKDLNMNSQDIDTILQDLGARIYNDKTNRIDTKVANDFINIAEIHALFLPENKKTAEYLHDAGRTAGYMRNFDKAIELYTWVVNKYPNDAQTANSTFMLGYTYDNDIKDYGQARNYYEQFLSKYGNHDLAASAKVLLENLGVPDDEIIEKLQKK